MLAVDGNSLIGVTQEQAAELISKTGPQVTLEVARNAAAYYGLANLLNQPSPQVSRHPRVMSHSQSYVNPSSALVRQASQQPPQPHFLSQQFLPQSAASVQAMQQQQQQSQPSYANAPPPVTSSALALQGVTQLGTSGSLAQEERHYQNISMYRQPLPPIPNPSNGLSNGAGVPRPLNSYPHPPHHNSYSSLHALTTQSAQQQQINSATLPHGRPMSTVFPNSMMHARVASMAQYPTYTSGPSSQMQLQQQPTSMQQPMYRSAHTGSVPVLHPSHQQWREGSSLPFAGQIFPPTANGAIAGLSHVNHSQQSLQHQHQQQQQQQMYGRNVAMAGGMHAPPSRVSIVSTKGLVDGEQPPTGYRYVPSAYPAQSIDSLNNNNNMLMNGHNNNNSANPLWRRNKNNSSGTSSTGGGGGGSNGIQSQEFSAHIEEQEERLRLLKLEEMKRHHELEVAQIAEDRLLKEAKTRRGQVSPRVLLLATCVACETQR